jgi:hypothetical protein
MENMSSAATLHVRDVPEFEDVRLAEPRIVEHTTVSLWEVLLLQHQR